MRPGDNQPVFRRRDCLQYLGLIGGLSLAGCAGDSSPDGEGTPTDQGGDGTADGAETPTIEPVEKQVRGTFVSGTSSEARSLHPYDLGDEATSNRLSLLYDGPGTINEDIEFEPRWFKRWDLSDSADVVEYELRDNLEWGAGYGQVTAEDFLYHIENVWQVQDNWSGYQYVGQYYIEGEPISFEQTGSLSIRAELPEPRANWLHDDPMLFALPLPKELAEPYVSEQDLEGLKQDEEITQAAITGNLGAFSFESWERNSKMRLTRNDDYYLREKVDEYANAPFFERLDVQVFDEQSTAYAALEAGDITSTSIEARRANQFSDVDGIKLWHSRFGSGIFWLNLNHRANGWAPIRESREVRQAFAHLFDKDVLINQVFQGNANPVDTFHPRWGPYYDDEKIVVFESSAEMAREKFESGTSADYGYDGETFVGPDGEQVELKMVIRAGSQSNEIVANQVKQWLADVGIAMTIDATEWSNLIGNYAMNSGENTDWQTGQFNGGPWDQSTSAEPWDLMYGLGFSHGAYAPWTTLRLTMTERGSFNMWGYTTDEFDIATTLNDAESAQSQSEARAILTDLFGFLSRDQPLVWSFNDHSIIGYRDRVGGLPEVVNAFSGPDTARELFFTRA